ncbi:MAG TPA: BREX protein BrxB domain-containing protein [Gemmatimonadaceae bacterium]|nr:MAG: DUF1788 domain-containing protein [Acidobacteriota bacterium]HTD82882.1 BREX protein BrxB domain-containing protein [Gemmatimonadaceae bacterium]
MGRIEALAEKFRRHIATRWQRTIAGSQRMIMIVYDKELERTLRERKGLFEEAARDANHEWCEVDVAAAFARWLGADEYAESYFAYPEDLALRLEAEFPAVVAEEIRSTLRACGENSVVALLGAGSLFGLARVSAVLRLVESEIQGRLLVFYPGQFENNKYRLLDAADGFNYMAVPILLDGGEDE